MSDPDVAAAEAQLRAAAAAGNDKVTTSHPFFALFLPSNPSMET